MEQQEQAKFEGWAIVEVMGHHRYAGFVTTQAFGQAVLFRVDVPALEEREEILKRPAYIGNSYVQPGATVKHGAVQGYTKLIGAGSIYAITPCEEKAALRAVESMQERPLLLVKLPEAKALPGPEERRFKCCGHTPEEGHEPGCDVGTGEKDEEDYDDSDDDEDDEFDDQDEDDAYTGRY